MGNNVRCKLFKGNVGSNYAGDADEQFNAWMEEITKQHDISIQQIDSTQSRYGAHMIFVYYTLHDKAPKYDSYY